MAIADSDGDVLHYYHLTPIGAVVPWLKTLTGCPALPAGWVECDGSVLSDAESPFDGETIPDLNGDNRFLRGNSTSGGTGGSSTYNTDTEITMNGSGTRILTSTPKAPPYYDVVWIIRIK